MISSKRTSCTFAGIAMAFLFCGCAHHSDLSARFGGTMEGRLPDFPKALRCVADYLEGPKPSDIQAELNALGIHKRSEYLESMFPLRESFDSVPAEGTEHPSNPLDAEVLWFIDDGVSAWQVGKWRIEVLGDRDLRYATPYHLATGTLMVWASRPIVPMGSESVAFILEPTGEEYVVKWVYLWGVSR